MEKFTLNVINRDAQAENLQKRRETEAAMLVFVALRAPEGLPVRARVREARVEFCINHTWWWRHTNTHVDARTYARSQAAYISL